MRAEPIGQRGRHFDPQRPWRRPGSFVTAGLSGFTVGGQKHPCRVPPLPPLRLGHLGGGEILAGAPQTFTAHRDRRAPRRQRRLSVGQPMPQGGQPSGFGEPLRGIRIAAHRAPGPPSRTPARIRGRNGYFAGTQRAPRLQYRDRGPQISDLGAKPAQAELVLILHRAGDRTGPPRRRHRRHRLLTLGPPHPVLLAVQHAQLDPARQLAAIHPPRYSPITPSASASAPSDTAGCAPEPLLGRQPPPDSPIRRSGLLPIPPSSLTAPTTAAGPTSR